MTYIKPHILFVDDDENVLNALRRSLHAYHKSWHMTFENDSLKALQFLKSNPCDILISDLDMPHMDGIELIKQAKELVTDCEAILLTGKGDFNTALHAINQAQVYRFFTKPCDIEDLVLSLDEILNKKKKNKQTDTVLPLLQEEGLARSTLELISPSIMVLEPNGKMVYANHSAETLLAQNDGLFVDSHSICRCLESDKNKALLKIIEEASKNPSQPARFLSIERPSLKRDFSLVVLSIQEKNSEGLPLTAVVITDPDSEDLNDPTPFMNLFGLTKSEAIIAQFIAKGAGLEKAAEHCGLTLSSARTYLKRIYSKTGVSGQADLVKLILSTPASLLKKTA